ncbi:MAG: hypothetical protein RJQ00_08495 [Vicingaceae bacterium]
MLLQISKLLTLISFILFLTQCKKEEDPEPIQEGNKLGTVELGKAGMELVPYQLNDTLTFKDSLGNSQQFIVVNNRTQFRRYHKSGGTDISTDYYDVEALYVILKGEKDNFFTLDLTAPVPRYVSNFHINKYYLYINMNLDISVPFSSWYYSYIDTMDFYYNLEGEAIPFYSDLTLINNTYSSIYELTDNSADEKVFYSTSLGIVGFRTKDNILWYLDN